MRLSFVYLVFGLSVLVHAAPLEEEDSNTLLNGLLSMLSTDDKEPTLVTADSDSDDMDWLDDPPAMVTPVTTGKPSSTTRSPVPVSSGPASVATPQPMSTSISTSTSTPIPLPKAATTSPTSVYDEISSDTHPFSRLPKDVRHSLSDMLIKFNATIQPMLDELTANINIKLEEALQDPLQKSLNNVVNEFTMQVTMANVVEHSRARERTSIRCKEERDNCSLICPLKRGSRICWVISRKPSARYSRD
ncbi:hypothetical protein BDF22DRAFT_767057 [Syncephalis plumigaleata]|nr:hypothetical protein BDF22DRAFT_767057 [Syncephalis plumigaleata]